MVGALITFGSLATLVGFSLGFLFGLKERQTYGHSRFEAGIATGIKRERLANGRSIGL